MKTANANIKAIRSVREKLSSVNAEEVARKMGITRQGVYYHLNESRAESVNPDYLKKILDAIEEVKQDKKNLLKSIANAQE
jgi:predicted transcriptional regulator